MIGIEGQKMPTARGRGLAFVEMFLAHHQYLSVKQLDLIFDSFVAILSGMVVLLYGFNPFLRKIVP